MRHLRNLGNQMSIPIRPDEDGYLGRECPQKDCLGYFKTTPGTGLQGVTDCVCPYCGYKADHREFWTQDQIEYAKSVGIRKINEAIRKDLKEGRLHPIHYYREKQLETETVCDSCGLRYAVYGVFACCPDCGVRNSLQILDRNLELAKKMVALVSQVDTEVAEQLISTALSNQVAAFDSFGRQASASAAAGSSNPAQAEKMSFQNLPGARKNVQKLFGFDMASALTPTEWAFACQCFQKRHLLAHKAGVVDEVYIKETNDIGAVVGRKIKIEANEVDELADVLRKLGGALIANLP